MASGKQFYDEKEAEQILRLASKKAHAEGSMSRDQLIAAATELGISAAALEEAEHEYQAQKQEEEDRLTYDRHLRSELVSHLITYACANAFLIFIDIRKDGTLNWAFWPLIAWGLAVVFHAWSTFARSGSEYQAGLERWKRKRHRKEQFDLDDDLEDEIEDIADEIDIDRNRIAAIKELRDRTGMSLGEAKQALELYSKDRDDD